ncbi:STAS domain-containing protein [Streptomyces sp. NPDC097619]|uniref:STAS domain-containing protein n=1 Tax=Streptomyces sp. NPDC097619 TaxID=3157228 RepID=UPI00332AEA31
MTKPPHTAFTCTVEPGPAATLTVRVTGDLDHHTGDRLVAAVAARLADTPPPRAVRLDFGELDRIDSSGLSALIMIRRRTDAAGLPLYLERRPAPLDRLLRLTNTLDHLTAPVPTEDRAAPPEEAAGADAT